MSALRVFVATVIVIGSGAAGWLGLPTLAAVPTDPRPSAHRRNVTGDSRCGLPISPTRDRVMAARS